MDEKIKNRIEQQNYIYSVCHSRNNISEIEFCREIEIQNLFVLLKGLIEEKSVLGLYCIENEFLTLYSKKNKFTKVDMVYIPLHNVIEIVKIPKKSDMNIINLFP